MAERRKREDEEDPIAVAKRIALERAKAITSKLSSSGAPVATGLVPMGGRFERKILIPLVGTNGINYVGLIIGPKAKTLRDLQIKTGCKLEIRGKGMAKEGDGKFSGGEETHVWISGVSQDLVDKAAFTISEYFTNPEKTNELRRAQSSELGLQTRSNAYEHGKMTKVVNVPNDLAGAVIGKGGEQIKAFIAQSGAHIQIDNSPENMTRPMRDLTVQGTPEQIARAEQLISDFINTYRANASETMASNLYGAPVQASIFGSSVSALTFPVKLNLEVPDNKVGLIIGKGGKTIHQIQNTFRCKVDIPQKHDSGNPEVRTITVGALTEAEMEGAKNNIFNVITYGQLLTTSDTPTTFAFQSTAALPIAAQFVAAISEPFSVVYESPPIEETRKNESISNSTTFSAVLETATNETPTEDSAEQKYTKSQWRQWREYYLQQGQPDIGDDAPEELRSENYEDDNN